MSLDLMLEHARTGTAVVEDGWSQGRATFGGLVGALMLARATALMADPARVLRAATVSFVGPVETGDVTLDGELLRAGSAVTQVRVTLVQDGRPAAAMQASFGLPRESPVVVDPDQRTVRPALPAPDEVDVIPYLDGVMPEHFARIELRPAAGAPFFTGSPEPDFAGWMRYAAPRPPAIGAEHLMALTDAWPPSLLPMLTRPAPVSTLTWSYEPVGAPPPGGDDPDAYWQYEVRTDAFGDGYGHAGARVWDASGRLRAISRQTVVVFA